MKTAIFLLFLIPTVLLSQNNDILIKELNSYADSVDKLILDSSPWEIYCNTINTVRNERAIGIQETKISFYYKQKDDSVYEDKDGIVYFIPQYNPPLMVKIEYNIANSQTVTVKYYLNGENYLYNFDSKGEYGNINRTFWFGKNELLRFEEKSARDEMGVMIENEKFSKDTYNESMLIKDKIEMYKNLYYDIFEISYKDK